MKKNLIIIGVVLVIFVLIMSLSMFTSDADKIKKSLLTYGFSEVEKKAYYTDILDGSYDDYVYDGSRYKILSFNMENYTLSESLMEKSDDVDFTYSANFDCSYDTILYNARYTYNKANVILEGTFNINDKEYICNAEVSYGADLTQVKNELCDELKAYALDFSTIIDELFDEEDFNIMKNNR